MLANVSRASFDSETLALFCHCSYMCRRSAAGPVVVNFPRLLGEIHFVSGEWSAKIVAHECFHATICVCRGLQADPKAGTMQEELAAYVHDRLFEAVYRWLRQVDKKAGPLGRLKRRIDGFFFN